MRFLVDAQLSRRFVIWLNEAGHDALHTLDLPLRNLTPDSEVVARAMQDGRVVVSKDADFVQTFYSNELRFAGESCWSRLCGAFLPVVRVAQMVGNSEDHNTVLLGAIMQCEWEIFEHHPASIRFF